MKFAKAQVITEIGNKSYSFYITDTVHKIELAMEDNDIRYVETVAARCSDGSLWYPSCGEQPKWVNITLDKFAIKALLEMPEPRVNYEY
ncbi:MAG: hypothetical protein SOT17_03395 [Lactobacillus johnsonii]|nr:hypothetical protein [Lactobacillus johnsonii]MDY2874299.1 hypothetical protein [Lactobacillus johnsonii]